MSTDLVAFLAARVDEDEARLTEDEAWTQRPLREVAAKRAILAEWEEANQHRWDLPGGVREGRDDDERERDDGMASLLDGIVAILCAVYSDHPDYEQEWKAV